MMIINDEPIKSIKEDNLGREPVVDLIVESINHFVKRDHPCVTYGIYGKWGEGKTSLMNFVKEKLLSQGKDDGISIVEFNPWLVNNEETLLTEFFNTLMTPYDDKVRRLFMKYGSLAVMASKTIVNAFVPGVGIALAGGIRLAQKALKDSRNTLTESKQRVSKAIKDSGRHLIVMIDDVDRLDKEELHTVFRLIRQVANFPNCIYIVAMDAEMVAHSIGEYYGEGKSPDGRKFLEKIIQIPITIPQVPQVEIRKLVWEELSLILKQYADEKSISAIVDSVAPFLGTCREIKRYRNQLSFVLPHLEGEVNFKDLCILEAIKGVSVESYNRVYEKCHQLMHELDSFQYQVNKEKETEAAELRYQEAKEYVANILSGRIKGVVMNALDDLFGEISFDHLEDLDKKSIINDEYFAKYFSQKVPSDVIPDRLVDSIEREVAAGQVNEIVSIFNKWIAKYPASEIRRASLHIIRQYSSGEEQGHAAAVIAKTLSICELAKGLPKHAYINRDDITAFVPNAVIRRYMFIRLEDVAGIRVRNEAELNETLTYIYSQAELNYCLNMLCCSNDILKSGSYDGQKVLPILINRFSLLNFDEQFSYSKFLLATVFSYWKRVDVNLFNDYAMGLFADPTIPYLKVFDKFIDGADDREDSKVFVMLFYKQIPIIAERIKKDQEHQPENHHSVRVYSANYRQIIENYQLK